MKAQIKRAGYGYSINAIVEVVRDLDANTLFVRSKHLATAIPKRAVRIINKDNK